MMRMIFAVTLLLSACGIRDETVTAYGGAGQVWVLEKIDGVQFQERATISFPQESVVEGKGPCNQFTAKQNAPYPWFELSDISATLMACDNLSAEATYFKALESMELVEVLGSVMLLKTASGREMVFRAQGAL